jgi:hypothetical protein
MSLVGRIALLGLAALSAPVSAKDERRMVEPGTVKSVAIVNRVPAGLNYTHRAVTAFGNEKRVLAVDWNPSQMLADSLLKALQDGGIAASVVELSAADEAPTFGKKCWTTWTSKYKPQCLPAMAALLDRLQADMIIVLQPFTIQDYYYGSPVQVTGLGLHTAGVGDTIKQSVVVSHVSYAQYSRQGPLDGEACVSTEIEGSHAYSASPETLAAKDVAWTQDALRRLLDGNAVRTLRASGVLPGGYERCPRVWGRNEDA